MDIVKFSETLRVLEGNTRDTRSKYGCVRGIMFVLQD